MTYLEVDRPRLIKILDELELPEGQWAVSGSGVMVLHGIERSKPMGDLDLFLSTRAWCHLAKNANIWQGRGSYGSWNIWTTDPDDPKRRCDPPYLSQMFHGLEVNIFSDWRTRGVGDIDTNLWVHNAEMVDGYPCIRLDFLLDWKETMGRAKDIDDIHAIKEFMKKE